MVLETRGLGMAIAAAWTWAALRKLAIALRPQRRAHTPGPSDSRRRYVFGAISRETFEAAKRKARHPRSRPSRLA
jgi:hypothetical protein